MPPRSRRKRPTHVANFRRDDAKPPVVHHKHRAHCEIHKHFTKNTRSPTKIFLEYALHPSGQATDEEITVASIRLYTGVKGIGDAEKGFANLPQGGPSMRMEEKTLARAKQIISVKELSPPRCTRHCLPIALLRASRRSSTAAYPVSNREPGPPSTRRPLRFDCSISANHSPTTRARALTS